MAETPPRTTAEQAVRDWTDALSGATKTATKGSAAQRLADALDWTDAIALAGVLDAPPAAPGHEARSTGAGTGTGTVTAASQKRPLPEAAEVLSQGRTRLLRVVKSTLQEALGGAIAEPTKGPRPGALLGPAPVAPGQGASNAPTRDLDPATLRTAVRQAQRQLESGVAALRAALRARLASGTPAQRELAAIDAILEKALLERQRHLLSGAAARLSRLGENGDSFAVERGLMAALSAELELRLQPLQGLAQALQPIDSTLS